MKIPRKLIFYKLVVRSIVGENISVSLYGGQLLHLGLDLDGTIADHTEAKLRLARELGYDFTPAETASEAMKLRMATEDYRNLQRVLYDTPLVDRAFPMIGAREALEDLKSKGWRFSIVSRRHVNTHEQARAWATKHFSACIAPERVFFVEDDAGKNVVCEREGITAFVDDLTTVLGYLGSVSRRVLFDPYDNWLENLPSGLVRMRAWEELPERLGV